VWSAKKGQIQLRVFQETMEHYQATITDHCEVAKGCYALRILEAQDDFTNEVSLLETLIQQSVSNGSIHPLRIQSILGYIQNQWISNRASLIIHNFEGTVGYCLPYINSITIYCKIKI
jgi:hypothetical protein